jgi:hypothetical protein
MPIIRFEKEDDKQHYLDWRKLNHQGFILNINTWNSKSMTTKNIIHLANWCSSLDTPPAPNRDRPITSDHPKLCSMDIRDLVAEMEAKDLPYKLCGLCMKGY